MTRDNIFFSVCAFLLGLTLGGLVIGPRVAKSKWSGAPVAQEASAEGMPASGDAMPASAPFANAGEGGGGAGGGGAAPFANAGGAGGAAPMAAVMQQLQTLKDTVARDPKNVEALVQLGNMYMDANKSDQAATYYEQALAIREDANVRTDLGICYKNAGKLEESRAAFAQAASEAPDQWQPKFNEAVVLVELKRFDEARKLAAELNASRPNDPEIVKLQQALAKAN